MTVDKATQRIYCHAGFQTETGDVGLGELIRPYRRQPLDDALADIAASLIALHPILAGQESVSRELCAALWHLCDSTRTITKHGLRRNKLAPAEQLDRLDAWVDAFESFCIRALSGHDLAHCLSRIIGLLAEREFEDVRPFRRLTPALTSLVLDDESDFDIAPDLARAVANLSPPL